jgi:hypothetical protein
MRRQPESLAALKSSEAQLLHTFSDASKQTMSGLIQICIARIVAMFLLTAR